VPLADLSFLSTTSSRVIATCSAPAEGTARGLQPGRFAPRRWSESPQPCGGDSLQPGPWSPGAMIEKPVNFRPCKIRRLRRGFCRIGLRNRSGNGHRVVTMTLPAIRRSTDRVPADRIVRARFPAVSSLESDTCFFLPAPALLDFVRRWL
jgi:hypothetical protein